MAKRPYPKIIKEDVVEIAKWMREVTRLRDEDIDDVVAQNLAIEDSATLYLKTLNVTPTVLPVNTDSTDGMAFGAYSVATDNDRAIAIGVGYASGEDSVAINTAGIADTPSDNAAHADWSFCQGYQNLISFTGSFVSGDWPYSVLMGGRRNIIEDSGQSMILSSVDCEINNNSDLAVIIGSDSCTIGNGTPSAFSTANFGIYSSMNSAVDDLSSLSVILGGTAATFVNSYECAIVSGISNTITNSSESAIIAGDSCSITGAANSLAYGIYGNATHSLQVAHGSGVNGMQSSQYIQVATTTNATPTEMFIISSGRMVIPTDSTWGFSILVTARRTDADNESATFEFKGCIDNTATVVALVGSVTKNIVARDTAAWDADATADNTHDALIITVTGQAAKTIKWCAHIRTVEITG